MFKIRRKKLFLIFSLLTFLVIVSCVPVVTQKSAVCGSNQTFNNITRTCNNIVGESRYVPVATLSSDSLVQETSKLINLTYTDKNNDAAISCKALSTTAQIETYSPILFDGRLFASVDSVYTASAALSTLLSSTIYTGTALTTATTLIGLVPATDTFRTIMKNTFIRQTVTDNLLSYKTAVDNIITNAAFFINNSASFPKEFAAISLIQTRLADLVVMMTFMDNHCYCSGGFCSTFIVSKMRQNGTAGFSYTITDRDGESALKSVAITIPAMSLATAPQYAPTVKGSTTVVSFAESANQAAAAHSFQLPQVFGDYFASLNPTYTYHISGCTTPTCSTPNGLVSCSISGACTYWPKNGDVNSTSPVALPAAAKAKALTISGMDYNAVAIGSNGNNIKVNFYDLHSNNVYVDSKSSPSENFALVDGNVAEGYVRVVGNSVNVFVNPTFTTFAQVASLINSDPKASLLVVASVAASNLTPNSAIGSILTSVTLSGGVDDYDKFSYYVNNGYADSTTVDLVLNITPTDDPPLNPTQYNAAYTPLYLAPATTTAMLEDTLTSQTIILPFIDVDSSGAEITACTTTFTTGLKLASLVAPCSCVAGVCSVTILPNQYFSGTGSFDYTITSKDHLSASTQTSLPMTVNVAVTPVNHFPFIINAAFATTDRNVGTPVAVQSPNENGYAGTITTVAAPANTTVANIATITGVLTPITMKESISTAEQTATLTLTTTMGGAGTEEAPLSLTPQTISSITAVSSNPTLVTPTVSGNVITFAPTLNQSGSAVITITITDSGGSLNGGVNISKQTVALTVSAVNDYPFFTTSACSFNKRTDATNCLNAATTPVAINCVGATSPVGNITPSAAGVFYWDAANTRCYKSTGTSNTAWIDQAMTPAQVETNEGDTTLIDFSISEDIGNTANGNTKGIYLVKVMSDNQTLLPDANITAFYDLNDNGILDAGEGRDAETVVAGRHLYATSALLESAAANPSLTHKLYLALKPVTGQSGNANITLEIRDDAGTPKHTIKTFAFLVHSISAIHGGWSNIAAIGIKTDKNNNPVDVKTDVNGAIIPGSDILCNYNKLTDLNSCTDANGTALACTGLNTPAGTIIPAAANVMYWDSANKKCYRAQSPPDKFSWIDLTTTCPITRIAKYTSATCPVIDATWKVATAPSATAIGQYYFNTTNNICYISTATGTASWTPAPEQENWITTTAPSATAIGQFYYNPTSKICYRSTATGALSWSVYTPSKVTVAWNPFNLSGTGSDANVQIAGWNVYRREVGQNYNFNTGFLTDANSSAKMTITVPGTRTFTDATAVAGKVYYYTVRPVDSIRNLATYTPEIFSEVRVIAPPPNYAFAHRWMINQEMCNSMNMTTSTTTTTTYPNNLIVNKVDQTHNYRCPYVGPGEVTATVGLDTVHFYDYGQDLLVDISEMGCPYSASPTCTDASGNNVACVGIGTPNAAVSAIDGSIFYDRSSGICYVNNTGAGNLTSIGTGWTQYTAAAHLKNSNAALNPPLTNISEAQASTACGLRTIPTTMTGVTISGVTLPGTASLPEKKDYMAYASPPSGMLDPQITELEQGFSLDIQSRCNGSNASGLTAGYTDSVVPSSSQMFSIPGTSTSGIRSVITGSVPVATGLFSSTEACASRFGVQDVWGNVAEWVKDSMTCTGGTAGSGNSAFTCSTVAGTAMYYNFGTFAPLATTVAGFNYYGFNNITGPFNDASSNGYPDSTDGYLTAWDYSDRLFAAGNFSFPLGLPLNTNIATTATNILNWITAGIAPNILDIGVGITSAQLHGDGILVNADALLHNIGTASQAAGSATVLGLGTTWNASMVGRTFTFADGTSSGTITGYTSPTSITVSTTHVAAVTAQAYATSGTATGNFAVGGSYLSGARSGRFTMELIENATTSTRPDVGFRCILPVTHAAGNGVTSGAYTDDLLHPYRLNY